MEFMSAILNSIPTNHRALIPNRNRYKTCSTTNSYSVASCTSLHGKKATKGHEVNMVTLHLTVTKKNIN